MLCDINTEAYHDAEDAARAREDGEGFRTCEACETVSSVNEMVCRGCNPKGKN